MKFSLLSVLEVVILTTGRAASDAIFIKMITFRYKWISFDLTSVLHFLDKSDWKFKDVNRGIHCSCGNIHLDIRKKMVYDTTFIFQFHHPTCGIISQASSNSECQCLWVTVNQPTLSFNSLAPGKFEWNFRYLIFQIISVIDVWVISCEVALIWMSLNLTDDNSTLVQAMAWCRQATSHYLSQCWPRSVSPYGVARPQWLLKYLSTYSHLGVFIH